MSNYVLSGPDTGDTKAHLVISKSVDGVLEWMSLHTDKELIHCKPSLVCTIVRKRAKHNMLYVEGVNGNPPTGNLSNQLTECSKRCTAKGKQDCKFWTLSFHNDTKVSRKHEGNSECGLR
jgi:hypothetical protein